MKRTYKTTLWSIELPDGWQVQDKCGDASRSIFRADGVGVLQLVTFETPLGEPAVETAYIEQRFENYSRQGYSRVWMVHLEKCHVIARYSCARSVSEVERVDIEDIVGSLVAS